MKKTIILILSVFLLSGCTVNYNLEYIDETFKEHLEIITQKDELFDGQTSVNTIDNYYSNINLLVDYQAQPGDMPEEEIIKNYPTYNKTLINKEYEYGINLDYTYKDIKYENSAIVFTMFENIQITEDSIKLSNGKNIFNHYDNLDEIIVSFKTDKKVLETNADQSKDNIYYWHINKLNYDKKTIQIKINKDIILEEYNQKIDTFIKYIFIVLPCLLILGIIFILIKFKNSNKK